MDTTTAYLAAGLEAVSTAASLTRAVQAGQADIRQHLKDDRSPVTVADYAAQALVAMVLSEHFPNPNDRLVVGEESTEALMQPDQHAVRDAVTAAVRQWRPAASQDDVLAAIDACGHQGEADAYWTLDPVDGTKGFLRGQQYAIALGRIERGQVTLGILGCPNLSMDTALPPAEPDPLEHGSLYAATLGGGAWEYPQADPMATPLRIQAATWQEGGPVRPCASVEAGHSNRSATDELLDRIGADTDPVRLDSQAKYAVLARGQADAYLRLPTSRSYVEKIWDHAGGSLVATESGAIVTDVGGAPLDFGHGARLTSNRGVIAAVPGLHERLIEASMALGLINT